MRTTADVGEISFVNVGGYFPQRWLTLNFIIGNATRSKVIPSSFFITDMTHTHETDKIMKQI